MQKKSLLCAVLLLCCFVSIFSSVTAFADQTESGELHIVTTKTDDGFVQVDMYAKNARFAGLQTVFRYNPKVWTPVDASWNATTDFDAFAELKATFFQTVGTVLDTEKGLFEYTCFIIPETKYEGINDMYEIVAGVDGIHLYTFRFKQIAEGDAYLEIATPKGELPYQDFLPDGLMCLNYTNMLEMHVYSYEQQPPEKPEVYVYGTYAPKPEMTKALRKQDTICMIVGKSNTITYGKRAKIDANNAAVVPYVDNDRTYVPLRFISEAFGAEVIWEEGMDGCIIKKDQTTIELVFDSCEFKVNGETVVNDVPIQLKHDRTMVPVRFVAEQLGCDVYWNELNEAVVISPDDNPWVEDRRAEIEALNEMMLTIVGIL